MGRRAGREKRKAYLEFDGVLNSGDPASYGSTEHALQIVLNAFLGCARPLKTKRMT